MITGNGELEIRFAEISDVVVCASIDDLIPNTIIATKIEHREIVIAEYENRVIGYLRMAYLWSRIPCLTLIRIHKEFRHQGIGRTILQFIEEELRQKGIHTLLSSAHASEPSPQAWHRAVGFKECGFLAGINEGGIGEIFYRKSL